MARSLEGRPVRRMTLLFERLRLRRRTIPDRVGFLAVSRSGATVRAGCHVAAHSAAAARVPRVARRVEVCSNEVLPVWVILEGIKCAAINQYRGMGW